MKRYPLLLIFFIIYFLNTSAFAQSNAGVLNFDAKGSAPINQDITQAREKAIQDGLQKAVMAAVESIAGISVKDEKFQSITETIAEQYEAYVNNYKITGEKQEPESFTVNINVAVAMVSLKNDLNNMGVNQSTRSKGNKSIITLNIKGLNKYEDFSYLKQFLQSHNLMVKNIYPGIFEWKQVRFEVEILVPVQTMINELARTGRYALETKRIENRQIEMTCLQIEREK
jgi:hypothetical protein